MIDNKFNDLICLGCELNCGYLNSNLFNKFECGDKKLVVWPADNYFFKLAVNEAVFKRSYCFQKRGVIVVDLSVCYLYFFLTEIWIEFLKETKLMVILVAGHGMLPLANFWVKKVSANWFVVDNQCSFDECLESIKRIMHITRSKYGNYPHLNDHEMYTLRLMQKGCSNHEIASRLQCDIRNVYRLQDALKRKMHSPKLFRDVMFRQAISTGF